jgi:YjbE family integral membrane protein
MEFLSALAAIVLIDLVLAGDNAIVIALAARSLPKRLRTKAIIWGTFGAVALRSTMTLFVVWLLDIPGLMLAGGLLLVWIGWKLVSPADDNGPDIKPATSFWAAIKTIVVADAVMGIDNVMGVAGAAHGSFMLVVVGLLISIPIVIFGSTLVLKWMERFPAIIYVGAGVIAWTATTMITEAPLIKDYMAANEVLRVALYVLIVGGVVGFGYLRNRHHMQVADNV